MIPQRFLSILSALIDVTMIKLSFSAEIFVIARLVPPSRPISQQEQKQDL